MDVLSQALSVVKQAEERSGPVTLTFNLDDPAYRAAYVAALAVLQVNGIIPAEAGAPQGAGDTPAAAGRPAPARRAAKRGTRRAAPVAEPDAPSTGASDARDGSVRRSYAEAIAELTPDVERQQQILKDTYERVRDLLYDGANVEAVAQVQYRRWSEEHLDGNRN